MRKQWSHVDLVARHLLVRGRVEAIDAIYSFEEPDGTTHRVTRLARVVFNLKRQYGWEIETLQPRSDLLATYVLTRPGLPTPRTADLVARWQGKVNAQPPEPAAVSVAPAGAGGNVEGLFEAVEAPATPTLRPSDYACGKVETVKGGKESCLRPMTHIFAILLEARFVEGNCPKHGRTEGSLIKPDGLPTGWGKSGMPAPVTTKARVRRTKKR